MKTLKKLILLLFALSVILSAVSCSSGKGGAPGGYYGGMEMGSDMAPGASLDSEGAPGDSDSENKNDQISLPSGMITAGAWVDNDNYSMWLDLFVKGQTDDDIGKFYRYTEPNLSWGFNSLNRIKVNVKNGDSAVAGATVIASDTEGKALFSAVTDAKGDAYLFTNAENGSVTVTSGEGSATADFTADSRDLSVTISANAEKLDVIELMFVVDVTGSMGDEIDFLKAELAYVIDNVAAANPGTAIKLALLFYRDTDDRVPFDYYGFTDVTDQQGLVAQQSALNSQRADGGGDYPEAVDKALELAVNKQWSTGATTKLIFFVLDAPAHGKAENKQTLVNATKIAAEKGIRICPIICSGAAEETEYTMREAAIYTGGTFIFVTDDSGIGNSHHDPDLPNTTVELLNSMLVRLINGYHTGTFAPATYWKNDPGLATK